MQAPHLLGAASDQGWWGRLWMTRPVINRQVTRLSSFYAQARGPRIAAMRSHPEPEPPRPRHRPVSHRRGNRSPRVCTTRAEVDFFPARGESVRDAKAVCARCPVRSECLEFALRLKVAHGVWGGLSERERRTLRRDRHRAATA